MKPQVLLIAALGAGAAYFFFRKNQAMQPAMPMSVPQNYAPSQPAQQYPWVPIQAPRADNANQPWYNNAPVNGGAQPTGLAGIAAGIQAGSSIVHSVADVWGQLSSFWPKGDNELAFNAVDNYSSLDMGGVDESWFQDDGGISGDMSYEYSYV